MSRKLEVGDTYIINNDTKYPVTLLKIFPDRVIAKFCGCDNNIFPRIREDEWVKIPSSEGGNNDQ